MKPSHKDNRGFTSDSSMLIRSLREHGNAPFSRMLRDDQKYYPFVIAVAHATLLPLSPPTHE